MEPEGARATAKKGAEARASGTCSCGVGNAWLGGAAHRLSAQQERIDDPLRGVDGKSSSVQVPISTLGHRRGGGARGVAGVAWGGASVGAASGEAADAADAADAASACGGGGGSSGSRKYGSSGMVAPSTTGAHVSPNQAGETAKEAVMTAPHEALSMQCSGLASQPSMVRKRADWVWARCCGMAFQREKAPDSRMARSKSAAEVGATRWFESEPAPADSPKSVTRCASAPNDGTCSRTQRIAKRWSSMPQLPVAYGKSASRPRSSLPPRKPTWVARLELAASAATCRPE
jgi:hypothetical protein